MRQSTAITAITTFLQSLAARDDTTESPGPGPDIFGLATSPTHLQFLTHRASHLGPSEQQVYAVCDLG
jgi:hypothetical protein